MKHNDRETRIGNAVIYGPTWCFVLDGEGNLLTMEQKHCGPPSVDLTAEERKELAEYMAERWTRWGSEEVLQVGAGEEKVTMSAHVEIAGSRTPRELLPAEDKRSVYGVVLAATNNEEYAKNAHQAVRKGLDTKTLTPGARTSVFTKRRKQPSGNSS